MVSDPHGHLRYVHPVLSDWVHYAATQVVFDLRVASGLRSMAEQEKLYAQGRTTPGNIVTNALPGQSAHNYGLAIDVYPYSNGKIATDAKDPRWTLLIQTTRTFQSTRVEDGQFVQVEGDAVPGDRPHIQVRNWQAFKNWNKGTAVASVLPFTPKVRTMAGIGATLIAGALLLLG